MARNKKTPNKTKKIKVVINFKTYKQGKKVLKIAKEIEKISKKIIIGAQATDIRELSKKTKLDVYCQHADFQECGRATGFVLPEAIKESGAKGTFLNHSEHPLSFDIIKKTIKRCKKLKLKVLVFVKNLKEAKKIEKLNPDFIVYEPPELVAGKISVSKAKPELISKFAETLKKGFLVGAGIHSKEDVVKAIQLGAKGVAISSSIVKSKNPKKELEKFLGGFQCS